MTSVLAQTVAPSDTVNVTTGLAFTVVVLDAALNPLHPFASL